MKNTLFAAAALLTLSAAAEAAVIPVKIPALGALGGAPAAAAGSLSASALPSLKPIAIPSLPAPVLPAYPAPVQFPRRLPGAPSHVPISFPAPLHEDEIHLDWSFLDGGASGALVAAPVSPAPKPLPPAGAAAQLTFAAGAAKTPKTADAGALFDHSRRLVLLAE